MMKAIIENGVVTALMTGDVDCGVPVPVGLPVSTGWLFDNERFSAPPQVDVSPDAQTDAERQWRAAELAATDWLVTRHRDELDVGAQPTLGGKQFSKLQAGARRCAIGRAPSRWRMTCRAPNHPSGLPGCPSGHREYALVASERRPPCAGVFHQCAS